MAIIVVDSDGVAQQFADANTWHIDQDKHLHLRSSGNKAVASFANGCWQSVGQAEEQV